MKTVFVAAALGASLGLAAFAPGGAHAATPEVYTGAFSKVAVEGYDPVAYFTQGRPVQGRPEHSTDWKGAEYRFASAANLAKFKASPATYAPQYGGYCAWAVSQGYTAKGAANHWKVVNGKLYLNYNGDVQKIWEKNVNGHIVKANGNWPKVLAK